MRAVYERDLKLRRRAKHVFLHGEQPPSPLPPLSYVESATAARLRREFESVS